MSATHRTPPADRGSEDPWHDNAQWWADTFTDGVDAEYEQQIIPLVVRHAPPPEQGTVLDVGCGEGHLARALAARRGEADDTSADASTGADAGTRTHGVLGVDTAPAMLARAVARGGGVDYLFGSATALPFPDGSVAAVVSCLVMEHIEDLDAAIGEAARVLAPGGRLLLFLNHPFLQPPGSGWIHDQIADPPEQYWRVGPYLEETTTLEQVDHDIALEFHHRPLSRYLNSAASRGLHLVHMEEPSPPAEMYTPSELAAGAAEIPRLIFLALQRC